ncbi:homeobox-DDT domain protein RLT3-like isoform X3 [Prunus yedoensis var. nudiflora]|uniref:Homeobox-DDT domain protein RLT3-like isoform X3 n=1 Tax=Prunus yedoensis var. nudiflora TaxID=2094558 RepID=A0A314Y135_PRUYE|nr:homeobox-DDT domain protein RLT3-like isoform X3 [Prunus yedoensis var. nudiflora]
MVTVYTEIDESHPGEVWLLGLMEGEYSYLSIEEKLSTNVAPIDLLQAGSSVRMEALCALLSVLDDRGKREALLIANDSLPSSGVVALEVRKKGEQQKQKWSRIQVFDSRLWNSFYLDLNSVKHGKRSYFDTLTRCESCHDLYWRHEKHCRICHTTFELHFDLEESNEDVLQLKRFQATHIVDRLEENRTSVEEQPRNELSGHDLDN